MGTEQVIGIKMVRQRDVDDMREIRGDVRKEIRKDEDRVSGSRRTLSESIVEWKNGERKLGYELHKAAWLFLI